MRRTTGGGGSSRGGGKNFIVQESQSSRNHGRFGGGVGGSGYDRFGDDAHSDRILLNEVAGGMRNNRKGVGPFPPPNAIAVERRFEVF